MASPASRLALALCILVGVISSVSAAQRAREVLYVWAGGNGNKDFISVVDFDAASATYGKELARHHLPAGRPRVRQSGNEPHHCRLTKTARGHKLALGGLLSFLQGDVDDIFVYSVSKANPTKITFDFSTSTPDGGCIDEFIPYKKGFLTTAMCSRSAGAPGSITYVDVSRKSSSRWITGAAPPSFNPHGFDLNYKSLVVSDYVLPASLVSGPPVFRDTIRIFDRNGNLQATYQQPGAGGFMDFKYVPGTALGFASGGLDNKLYILTPEWPLREVFDLTTLNGGVAALNPGIMQVTANGKYLLLTYAMRYVVSFAINRNQTVSLVQSFDMCTAPTINCSLYGNAPGPHYIRLSETEDRITVVNYFLKFGVVEASGAQSLTVFNFNKAEGTFEFEPRFVLSYASENGSPHSFAHFKSR
eukprot:m.219956 g.219956  ORF g.219956 m.219956 type:complete len:417 (+) comp10282_c0_seq1:182-1432(+)